LVRQQRLQQLIRGGSNCVNVCKLQRAVCVGGTLHLSRPCMRQQRLHAVR
jgi:hypothetical protein